LFILTLSSNNDLHYSKHKSNLVFADIWVYSHWWEAR